MNYKYIKSFLSNLEENRKSSFSTRNQRLAAIHAFSKFVGLNSPEHITWYQEIHNIPFKKAKNRLINYLEKDEMDALLNAPDRKTSQGKRDYALLLFLYNTGARADELANLTIADLNIDSNKNNLHTVLIRGKGGKERRCPLWQHTVTELCSLISKRGQNDHVFINRCNQPITRFGIYAMVRRYVEKIAEKLPEIKRKRTSPHTIRHTAATHLLRAGVDINTIRVWLGHVSINTTNIYAEIDLDMKAKALACCEIQKNKKQSHWRDNKELMRFLNSI